MLIATKRRIFNQVDSSRRGSDICIVGRADAQLAREMTCIWAIFDNLHADGG